MMEFIKQELNRKTIFTDESKLSTNFIPDRLIHREDEFQQLTRLFKPLLLADKFVPKNILITGHNGSGKTALSKRFGHSFQHIASDFNKNIRYVHVNCRINRSNYLVVKRIIQSFITDFPERGFSLYELIKMLKAILDKNDAHIILTLDEMNFLDFKDDNLIYMLNRLNDHELESNSRVSIIGIVKNVNIIQRFDLSTLSTFQYNIISLKPYTASQVVDILKSRAELALIPGSYSDETLHFIANIGSKSRDMRYSLEILLKAGKYADKHELGFITMEAIRHAQVFTFENFDGGLIASLSNAEQAVLLSICRALDYKATGSISIDDFKQMYEIVCEEVDLQHLKRSQVYLVLNKLKDLDLICMNPPSSKKNGDSSVISVENIPVQLLMEELLKHV